MCGVLVKAGAVALAAGYLLVIGLTFNDLRLPSNSQQVPSAHHLSLPQKLDPLGFLSSKITGFLTTIAASNNLVTDDKTAKSHEVNMVCEEDRLRKLHTQK